MSRETMGGTRIATRPTSNVAGGVAGVSKARPDQLWGRTRPAWVDDPAVTLPCQQPDVDPDWWFESGTSAENKARRTLAIGLCGGCPMRVECADHAHTAPRETSGIWGGVLMERIGR